MGIFDQIKDALTTDDAERAEQAKQEAAKADKAAHDAGQATQEDIERFRAERKAFGDKQAAAAVVTYEVQPGDTLSGIAAKYGVNDMDIARANGIENPDLIYPGQVFTIPR